MNRIENRGLVIFRLNFNKTLAKSDLNQTVFSKYLFEPFLIHWVPVDTTEHGLAIHQIHKLSVLVSDNDKNKIITRICLSNQWLIKLMTLIMATLWRWSGKWWALALRSVFLTREKHPNVVVAHTVNLLLPTALPDGIHGSTRSTQLNQIWICCIWRPRGHFRLCVVAPRAVPVHFLIFFFVMGQHKLFFWVIDAIRPSRSYRGYFGRLFVSTGLCVNARILGFPSKMLHCGGDAQCYSLSPPVVEYCCLLVVVWHSPPPISDWKIAITDCWSVFMDETAGCYF